MNINAYCSIELPGPPSQEAYLEIFSSASYVLILKEIVDVSQGEFKAIFKAKLQMIAPRVWVSHRNTVLVLGTAVISIKNVLDFLVSR
jgi:hypothetical protein